jgi:hypothetical protein
VSATLRTTLEARDTEIAISFWKQKAAEFGKPPPIAKFNLVDFVSQSFRFLILADLLAGDSSVFLAYGAGFAKLFGLPERPSTRLPMIECIPNRYRFLFMEGCREAITEAAPIRFNGEVAGLGGSELYRACFMPLKMGINTMQAVYGSFNFRVRLAAELGERSKSDRASSVNAKWTELPMPAVEPS